MCGISVWINKKKDFSKEKFLIFNNRVTHRGPDSSSFQIFIYNDKAIAFGHRRLSIIDLDEKANQPMKFGSHTIVFNGEIYNYLELKQELLKNGITFQTKSDTEVLLKSYIYWKEKCLEKFNGMFSFLILDEIENNIFFARDRFGVKPLYYLNYNNSIYFGSEIKQFITLENFEPVGNINAIGNFIDNRYLDYSEETFFRNILQVKAGEAGFIDLDNLEIKKFLWYELDKSVNKNNSSFQNLFKQSIKLRLRSDVEVGACLSGGVDSNSIVCVADNNLSSIKKNYTLQTFTSCFEDKEFDERDLVEITKKKTSIKSNYIFPKGNIFFKDIENLIYFQDEPIWSSSIYAGNCIYQEINKNGIKVVLNGQGSDEVFCGYSSIFYPTYISSLSIFGKIKELFRSINKIYTLKQTIKSYLPKKIKKKTLLSVEYANKYYDNFKSLKSHVIHFMKFHLPPLLHYEDRNSMRHSVETRLPFLDYRLVEFGYHIPDYKKIEGGVGKKIIREALRDIVPDEIMDNKLKKGFVTPQINWMKTNKDLIIESIKKLFNFKIFDEKQLNLILQNFQKNKFDSSIVMRLYTLSVWIKVFNIKKIL